MAYKGSEIVQLARGCLGKSYGSYYQGHRMDCSGLVRYCLVKSSLKVSSSALGGGCKQQWGYFTGKSHKGRVLYRSSSMDGSGKTLSSNQVKAGDLMYKFFYDGGQNHHVTIATGNGYGTLDASGGAGSVREKSDYRWAFKDVDLWVRMYEDGATSTVESSMGTEASNPPTGTGSTTGNITSGNIQDPSSTSPVISSASSGGGSGTVSASINYDYSYLLAGGLPLTSVDTYKGAMTKILSQIKNESNLVFNGATLRGHSLGFLYDLTRGGYFKFLLPEFSESYQAKYDAISIPGRSSEIQSYEGTASPNRTVSLQLMAGEGLYKGSDPVTALHKDISFVKSLHYPSYQSAIVLPPSIVLLYLGPSSIVKGVVSNCSVNYKKPYTVDGKPMYVELSFTVIQATDNPPDYKDIRSNSSVAY